MNDLVMTVEEAAKELGISRNLAYRLAREQALPGIRRLGHRFIVSRPALNDYLQANKNLINSVREQ